MRFVSPQLAIVKVGGFLALQASLAVLVAISLWSVFTNGQSENYTDQD